MRAGQHGCCSAFCGLWAAIHRDLSAPFLVLQHGSAVQAPGSRGGAKCSCVSATRIRMGYEVRNDEGLP